MFIWGGLVFYWNIIGNMIKRLLYGFLGAYALFVTLNPLINSKYLSHWDNVKHSLYLSIGVVIGLLIDYAIRNKIKKKQ